jgi:MFS family permease
MMSNTAEVGVSREVYTFLAATILSTFFIGATFGLGYPLTALTLEAAQQPSWILGVAGAAPSLGIMLLLPLLPRLIAKLGAVRALVIGSVLSALGFLALYIFTGPWAWIALRFLMGVFLATGWFITQMWTTVAAPAHISGRVMAAYVFAFSAGNAVCPLLIEATGIAGPVPFVVGALLAVLAMVPVLPVARSAPEIEMSPVGSITHMLRVAPLPVVCCLLSGFVELSCFSLITNVALAGGMDAATALRLLTAFLVGAMLLQFVVGWLVDRYRPVTIGVGLCVVSAAATVALPWLLPNFLVSAVSMFLLGGVAYGIYTVAMALVSDEGSTTGHSVGNVAIITSYQAGGVVGPIVTGAAMTGAPVGGFVISLVVASILAAIALLVIRKG